MGRGGSAAGCGCFTHIPHSGARCGMSSRGVAFSCKSLGIGFIGRIRDGKNADWNGFCLVMGT